MASLISTCPYCKHWSSIVSVSNATLRYISGGHCTEIMKLIDIDTWDRQQEAWTAPTFGCILYERKSHATP